MWFWTEHTLQRFAKWCTSRYYSQIIKLAKRFWVCDKFLMIKRQQISHRVCNIWQCWETAVRDMTKLADILCQQIGRRNWAGFCLVSAANPPSDCSRVQLLLCFCCQSVSIACQQALSLTWTQIATDLQWKSDRICCQSANNCWHFTIWGDMIECFKNRTIFFLTIYSLITLESISLQNVEAKSFIIPFSIFCVIYLCNQILDWSSIKENFRFWDFWN